MNPGFPMLAMLGDSTPVNTPAPGSVESIGAEIAKRNEGAANAAMAGFNSLVNFFNSERLVTGILGLILIAGGIFLFKPVKDTIVNVGKTAAKAAA